MIKFVITSGFSTALIIEDDADWDVEIKSQMRQLSKNIRKFMGTDPEDKRPFGDEWDVLWIGHCGEAANKPTAYFEYPDTNRIDGKMYLGWAKKFWVDYISEGHRRIQMAIAPICLFGYGITHSSAQKILTLLGVRGDEGIDVLMQKQCASGKLRCLVVVPQLMVHHELPKESGYTSPRREGDGIGSSDHDRQFLDVMGTTANIISSARCAALFNSTCIAIPTDKE
jgi:hypothetical protein